MVNAFTVFFHYKQTKQKKIRKKSVELDLDQIPAYNYKSASTHTTHFAMSPDLIHSCGSLPYDCDLCLQHVCCII